MIVCPVVRLDPRLRRLLLHTMHREFSTLEAYFQQFFRLPSPPSGPQRPSRPGMAQRVYDHLQATQEPHAVLDLARYLRTNPQLVSNACQRLMQQRVLRRVRRGVYALGEANDVLL